MASTTDSGAHAKKQKHPESLAQSSSQIALQSRREVENGAWFSKFSDYLAVYIVYVFISGWAFGASYLQELGINQRWVDVSLSDVLVRGFTVLLAGGKWLLPLYLLVLLIPILAEIPSWKNRASIRIFSAVILVGLLWPIFLVSRSVGLKQAKTDRNPQSSRLQTITFSSKDGKKYAGKLVYLREGVYFIREARDINSPDEPDPSADLELSIYRAEDLQEVKVVDLP